MKAPCLHHHRVREGFYKLDQVPSEVVANVFKYIPTLDIGRMMVVCKGFNQILSANPSLWRFVELDKVTPKKSAFKIIQVFALRSHDTLVSIRTPEEPFVDQNFQIISLMERSKATLRRIDVIVEPGSLDDPEPPLHFFHSFPVIERLNLTSEPLPEAENQIPGVLTTLAERYFFVSGPWSEEALEKICALTHLHLEHLEDLEGFSEGQGYLHEVLKACRSSLVNLSIEASWLEISPLQFDLPNLSTLILRTHGDFSVLFDHPLPRLKHLEGWPMALGNLEFKNLESINFLVQGETWGGEEDFRFGSLIEMQDLVKDSSSTLTSIKIKKGCYDEGEFGIDPFLRTLVVDYLEPLCPLLSDLYVDKEQVFSFKLLAEVMISRNFAAKGWKLEGDEEERKCSELTLHLNASHIEEFKAEERKVLSRCPQWMVDQAGRTEIREWDGK